MKVALDPSPRQRRKLDEFDRAARFAFNWTLSIAKREIVVAWEAVHGFKRFWSFYGMRKLWNQWKPVVFPEWQDVSKEAFASGVRDACRALDNWYDSLVGKRKGRPVGLPRFRGLYGTTHSFEITTGSFGLMPQKADCKAVRIPRIGRVHAFENVRRRVGDGVVSSMRVVLEANRWFAVLVVHDKTFVKRRHKRKRPVVGLDLGCTDFVVSSDGTVVGVPKYAKRSARKIKKRRRALSRKRGAGRGERRSKGYRRAERKLVKATRHVENQRDDALIKLADAFCRTYDRICIEDLKSQAMARKGGARKRPLNRSIQDASFAKLRNCLFRQARKYDTEVVVVDRFFPSTKTCHRCGHGQKVSLAERTFVCESCGFVCNRDLNAALNIRDEGLKTHSAGSAPVVAGGSVGVAPHVLTAGTKQLDSLSVRLGAAVGNDGLIGRMDVSGILNGEFEDSG